MSLLKVIGTGSSGNCYALECEDQKLLLDVGVRENDIKKALAFDFRNVVGAVVTHSHSDHCKSEENIKRMGIKVLAPYHGDVMAKSAWLGDYKVSAFDLPHDGVPNYGFFIRMPNGERFAYLTDMEMCVYNFRKQRLNHILIECNHIDENLDEEEAKYAHVVRGHASLRVVKDFLEANWTEDLQTVILCHANALEDTDRMLHEVKETVGEDVAVWMAEKRAEYWLDTGGCVKRYEKE